MNLVCRNCDYQSLDYIAVYDVFRCPKCKWQITGQMIEKMDASSYGLFQIHESPLVPPGYVYMVNTSFLHQSILSQQFVKQFMDDIFNEYKPKEKPFDYRERASVEFDLGNESGLR